MRARSRLLGAFWPAILGVLAAHQLAYGGHDDGHLHGYLARIAPALVVAAVLGWIWSWARSRVDIRTVLVLQAGLFAFMEIAERLPGPAGLALSDLAPAAVGFALLPLIATMWVAVDRIVDLSTHGRCGMVRVDRSAPPLVSITGHGRIGSASRWSIRAPPSSV